MDPYAPPQAAPMIPAEPSYQPKIWSFSGRIGRLRYSAYYFLAMVVLGAVIMFAGGAGLMMGTADASLGILGGLVVLLAYVAVVVAGFAFARRRLNDLDLSGWLTLVFFVPLVGMVFALYVMLWPGTRGPNRYGPPPARNGAGVVVAGLLLPLVFMVGIIGAVALPAYQDYVTAVQQVQMQQP